MRATSKRQLTGMALAVSLAAALVAEGARADPLATAGIGVGNCAKLAGDMKPADGFNNMANVLIYFWVQGYMSAANITTLEADSEYIDLAKFDQPVKRHDGKDAPPIKDRPKKGHIGFQHLSRSNEPIQIRKARIKELK